MLNCRVPVSDLYFETGVFGSIQARFSGHSSCRFAYRTCGLRKPAMNRYLAVSTIIFMIFLQGCAGPPPVPEPGMEVVRHGHGEEMQVATGVDWDSYTKIILHNAPVEFRDNWKSDQERLHGKALRDEDVERIKSAVAGQVAKAMYRKLSEQEDFELTDQSGAGVMRFSPNIVDLDVQAAGWMENSILESLPDSRGRMTIELVIRDSVSDKVLAVAWQKQSDPREGEMELTISVSNTLAFRLMSQSWADWVVGQLGEVRGEG